MTIEVVETRPWFEMQPGDYIVGFWYISYAEGNWMSYIRRPAGMAGFEFVYRFRRYVDDKTFDSEDVKTGARTDPIDLTEEEVIAKGDLIAKTVESMVDADLTDRILVQGDPEKAIAELRARPWAHAKEMDT